MVREGLCLGEALAEERFWEADGVTVLSASVALPQLAGDGSRVRRFNRYYRRFCLAYFSYCELLLPEAAASCRAAMSVSAPWSAARAELSWRASRHADGLLSIVCDARETIHGLPPFLARRSEVWDLNTALPVPVDEFFPPRKRAKRALLRFAREETLRRVKCGTPYREDWRFRLRYALNPRNYYLTEEGLCFYYPLCSVADAKQGIVTFTMPYDEKEGPFPPRFSSASPQCDRHIPEYPAPQ